MIFPKSLYFIVCYTHNALYVFGLLKLCTLTTCKLFKSCSCQLCDNINYEWLITHTCTTITSLFLNINSSNWIRIPISCSDTFDGVQYFLKILSNNFLLILKLNIKTSWHKSQQTKSQSTKQLGKLQNLCVSNVVEINQPKTTLYNFWVMVHAPGDMT